MKASILIALCLVTFAGCSASDEACSSLRIGMTKVQVEAVLGRPDHVRISNAHANPTDLYMDVSIYSYEHKFPFSEDDVIYIANRENEVINIRCQDKPVRLRADGIHVAEDYIHRWRTDKVSPAKTKVTQPQ